MNKLKLSTIVTMIVLTGCGSTDLGGDSSIRTMADTSWADETRLYLFSSEDGRFTSVRLNGSAKQVLNGWSSGGYFQFSPDGKNIVLSSKRDSGGYDLLVLDSETLTLRHQIPVHDFLGQSVEFSPRGDRVLYLDRAREGIPARGETSYFILHLAENEVERLAIASPSSYADGNVKWSKDGKSVFIRIQRSKDSQGRELPGYEAERYDVDSGKIELLRGLGQEELNRQTHRNLWNDPGYTFSSDRSPDGRYLAECKAYKLLVSTPTRLVELERHSVGHETQFWGYYPRFSPGYKYLIYKNIYRDDGEGIYVYDIERNIKGKISGIRTRGTPGWYDPEKQSDE